MKTSPVSPRDRQRSVIAVPPLARDSECRLSKSADRALLSHLYEGGVGTVRYSGDANFYYLDVDDYADALAQLGHAGVSLIAVRQGGCNIRLAQ